MTCAAAALPPMVGAPMLNQGTPFPSAYMAPPSWSMYMPSCLPPAQAVPPSTLSEQWFSPSYNYVWPFSYLDVVLFIAWVSIY